VPASSWFRSARRQVLGAPMKPLSLASARLLCVGEGCWNLVVSLVDAHVGSAGGG